ncbi:MAG: phospholipase A [Moraxella sp.]|nr:phospholipase A [Moraxella sp.]
MPQTIKSTPIRLALAMALGLPIAAMADDGLTEAIEAGRVQFLTCAGIEENVARLACFDALAAGETPKAFERKRAVDLSSTLKNVVTLNPEIVRVDDSNTIAGFADGDIITASTHDSEVLTRIGVSEDDLARYTPLSLAYDLDKNSSQGLWSARPHNANYVLPLFLNTKPNRNPTSSDPSMAEETYTPNEMRVPELKFQLSLKTKAAENLFGTDADLWVGYTQQSHWQVYNEDNSRPFREHNYEPEVFLTQPIRANLPFGGRLRMLGVGAVHHSNGQSDPLSRSWNRAYLMAGMEWNKLTVVPRVWARVLKAADSSKPDDNPNILDYYGYGDVKFLYQLEKGKNVSGLARFNPSTGKGALQLDYVHPVGRGINGYVQLFHGYGESLIDYDHKSTTIGVGVMLNDWMGL